MPIHGEHSSVQSKSNALCKLLAPASVIINFFLRIKRPFTKSKYYWNYYHLMPCYCWIITIEMFIFQTEMMCLSLQTVSITLITIREWINSNLNIFFFSSFFMSCSFSAAHHLSHMITVCTGCSYITTEISLSFNLFIEWTSSSCH